MLLLRRYMTDFFKDKAISHNELLNFSDDSVQRTGANNPGAVFDPIIAATNAVLLNIRNIHTLLEVSKGQREGDTEVVNKAMEQWNVQARRIWNFTNYFYAENNPDKIEEIFPQGLTPYTTITLEAGQDTMDILIAAVGNNSADFDPAAVTALVNARNNFGTARTAQLGEKGEISGLQEAYSDVRKQLTMQLTVNVLTIALQFPGDEDKATVYFDQNLLRDKGTSAVEKVDGEIDGNATEEVDHPDDAIDVNAEIIFRTVSADATLVFWFAENAGDEPGTLKVEVGPDSEKQSTAANAGYSSTNRTLMVRNLSAVAAAWEVELVG